MRLDKENKLFFCDVCGKKFSGYNIHYKGLDFCDWTCAHSELGQKMIKSSNVATMCKSTEMLEALKDVVLASEYSDTVSDFLSSHEIGESINRIRILLMEIETEQRNASLAHLDKGRT